MALWPLAAAKAAGGFGGAGRGERAGGGRGEGTEALASAPRTGGSVVVFPITPSYQSRKE